MDRILSIILLIAIGWFLRRLDILKPEDSSVLYKIVIILGFPALIIISINRARLSPSLFKIILPAMITPVLVCVIAFALGKMLRLESRTMGAFMLVSSFGNTGFLGIPLTIKLLGEKYLPNAIIYDAFGTGVMVWIIGLSIAIYFGGKKMRAKLPYHLIIPPFLGLAIGFLVNGIALPPLVNELLEDLSATIVPLIMISIGITLGARKIRGTLLIITLSASIKLLASPLIAHLLGEALSLGSVSSKAALLQASMPTALATAVIGSEYDLSPEILSGAVLISTILTLVTTPMLLRLFG